MKMANKAKWREFSQEELEQIVKESSSNREVAEKLGYKKDGGGTMATLKKMYEECHLDTSHFKGQGWNKGNYDYDLFTKGEIKKNGRTTLKPLIALRGRRCECCGLTEWLGNPINLQIHHEDGDRLNNSLENLTLLCPNCHSYTETFCRKTTSIKVDEETLVQALKDSPNISQTLKKVGLRATGGNYTRARELIEKYKIEHLYV